MNAPVTADVLKQAQAMANAAGGEMVVDKVTLTKTATVYVSRPADWTAADLSAAVQKRAGDLTSRACWYDAESGPEITVEMGKDDRPVEVEMEDGQQVAKIEGPEPMALGPDDLTPVVITVVES